MLKVFKSYSVTITTIIIAICLIGSLVIASNMGFKLVYQLYATGASALTGTNWIGIPMNFPFTNASELKADIPNCSEVSRQVVATDKLESYTGARGSVNFSLTSGVAYIAKVTTDTAYVIVGSHDPSFGIPLYATGASALTGTNWVSVPYHAIAGNASDVKADVPNCTEVSRRIRSSDKLESYTGARGSVNFTFTPGEGLIIKVSTDTNWIPSHY